MTLGWGALASVLLLPLWLGAALLRLVGVAPRTDPLAYLGWAWIQGAVGLGALLSAWLWLAWPLEARWLAPAILALGALVLVLARRVPLAEPEPERDDASAGWEKVLFALVVAGLLVLTLDRSVRAANDVLASSDEAIIWAAKAKLLYHAGGFGPDFRAELASGEFLSHPDYPPLNPLLQLWVHAHAGTIVHVESRLPIQLFGLASVLIAAAALRRRARAGVAALFLIALATPAGAGFSMKQVFSDLLIATAALACWDAWQRYEEDGRSVWLRLLATLAPLLVWSKNEGLLHVLAFALAFAVARLSWRERRPSWRAALAHAGWAAPLALSLAYLLWFNAHFGLVNDLVQGSAEIEGEGAQPAGAGFMGLVFERWRENLGPILAAFARLIASGQTRLLVLVMLALVLLDPRRAFGPRRATMTLALVLVLLGYMTVYLGTHWEIEKHLKHSAHRLVYHLAPAAGLWVLLYTAETLPILGRRRRPGETASA